MPVDAYHIALKFIEFNKRKIFIYKTPCTAIPFDKGHNTILNSNIFNYELLDKMEEIRTRLINENKSNGDLKIELQVDRINNIVKNPVDVIRSVFNLNHKLSNPINGIPDEISLSEKDTFTEYPDINSDSNITILWKNGSNIIIPIPSNEGIEHLIEKISKMFLLDKKPTPGDKKKTSRFDYPNVKAKFLLFKDKIELRTFYSDKWISPTIWRTQSAEILSRCFIDAGLLQKIDQVQPIDENDPVMIEEGIWEYSNWDLIDFEENWIWFTSKEGKKIRFQCIPSKLLYQQVKRSFKIKGLKYRVTYAKDLPTKVKLDNGVFDFLDFGLMVYTFKNQGRNWHKEINKMNKFLKSFQDLNKIKKFIKFIGYSKSFYFEHLFLLQMDGIPVKVLIEPTHYENNSENHDLGFVFQVKGEKYYYAIWESIALKKATYIFQFESLNDCSAGIVKFADFLSGNAFQGRLALRENAFGYDKLVSLKHLEHAPQADSLLEVKEDRDWVNRLSIHLQ